MVAGCGMTCIKYILFVVNFLFFALGVAALALGIYALVDENEMAALTKVDSDGTLEDFNAVGLLQSGAIVLIVGGSCLLILGFLGCCGAIKEVKCLLAMYAGVVILILILQIAAAIIAIVFHSTIEKYLNESLIKGMEQNYDGNITSDNAFSRAFDYAQVYFECCGVNSTDNFDNTPWSKTKGDKKVPETCCALEDRDKFFDSNELVLKDPNCPTNAVGESNPNTAQPCYDSIEKWITDRAAIIIGIAVAIVVVEIVAICFALSLYKSIGYEQMV